MSPAKRSTSFRGETVATPARPDPRIANLDLLRAAAILLVVLFHLVRMWPASPRWLMHAVSFGRLGVDLFFVLSGWLIGGLFWREHRKFGDVLVGRFMLRRLIRTVPPYFAALAAVWVLGRLFRSGDLSLNWPYLVFLQNYTGLTTFHPSWSLCVEEHFYLVVPALLAVCAAGNARRVRFVLPVLAVMPLVLRNLFPGERLRHEAATHFWLDGLILGVWASYVRNVFPGAWASLGRLGRRLAIPAIAYVAANEYLPEEFRFRFGISLTALSFALILVAVAERPPLPAAKSRAVYGIAVASYSLYLTHTLAINAAKVLAGRVGGGRWWAYAAAAAVAVTAGGIICYLLVEAPSIRLRDRLAPRRPPLKETTAENDPGI